MFNKKNKKPRLDPLQQKREEDRQKEESRRGQILKERIWPLLVAEDKPVENTKIFLQVFEMALSQAHMKTKRTMTVADLKLEEDLKNNPEAERYHKMFEILNHENIEVADDLLKSMRQIIENHIQEENKNRKVSELKLKYFEK